MPYAEPNRLPDIYDNPMDWRWAYEETVADYRTSDMGAAAQLSLRIALKRLGYSGTLLQSEMVYLTCTATQPQH